MCELPVWFIGPEFLALLYGISRCPNPPFEAPAMEFTSGHSKLAVACPTPNLDRLRDPELRQN